MKVSKEEEGMVTRHELTEDFWDTLTLNSQKTIMAKYGKGCNIQESGSRLFHYPKSDDLIFTHLINKLKKESSQVNANYDGI